MKRGILAVIAIFLFPTLSGAGGGHIHNNDKMKLGVANEPPVKITINPEARVSAALVGALPLPAPCGTAVTLPVKIVNQGFMTSRLEAQLVDDAPSDVELDFHPDPLKGLPEERRELFITLTKPGPTDITIAFRAHNAILDLGGRNRIHFLMQCSPRPESLKKI